ncbi:hypothetical protein FAM22280_00587 [Lacticaseibacillus paracasei]|uniref:DUF1642 domain-containing protein n=1 Tax=Lacticaseibacillus paracasei TaxID=1597 RepID=UPI000FF1B386|nr:DUF1642 domain-containing protein [Lacticaseibacillus paracasei]RNE12475.1 hypothetical protein FAM22280_00587 [Lacticaseibacillus paracasei]
MSEGKLYAVKNDEGKYWDFEDQDDFWPLDISDCPTTPSKEQAEIVADEQGGHVVTLVEEPEKVVLTKEQAKIVKDAHDNKIPACHIANKSDDEELLMNAYVNGYTVEKDKRYLVELDGLVTTDNAQQYLTKKNGKWFACRRMPGMHQDFTDEELNAAPEWAQQLNREEVTDDEQ